ncbi:MAG: DUF2061 domain-containing protein [Pseudomonadales bacterium]|jgi:uncharacterized membrane protein
MESRTRSLLKAISWRITATLTTMIIAYVITGQIDAALAIGSIEFFLKFVIYYVHERAWLKIKIGQPVGQSQANS